MALQAEIDALRLEVDLMSGDLVSLQTSVNALKISSEPLGFVFAGVPLADTMINIPITLNLSIPANLVGSQYYNRINGSGTSTFVLRVFPANTEIGRVSVTSAGVASFSGTGSQTLAAGNTLRMTVLTAATDLTDVAITVQAARR